MIFVSNAFSLQMLPDGLQIRVTSLNKDEVARRLEGGGWASVVGHADTAAVISEQLGRTVPQNRANVALQAGDVLYVAQLTGGRLPEGATQLPEGFRLSWRRVDVFADREGSDASA